MTKIRLASEDDVEVLLAIEGLCFGASLRYSEEDFLGEVRQGRILVAEVRGSVMGYVGASVRDGFGFIDSLAVVPWARKEGVGGALLEAFIGFATGCRCIELNCDAGWLPGFYAKHGFEVCGYFSTDVGDRQLHRVRMRRVSGK